MNTEEDLFFLKFRYDKKKVNFYLVVLKLELPMICFRETRIKSISQRL